MFVHTSEIYLYIAQKSRGGNVYSWSLIQQCCPTKFHPLLIFASEIFKAPKFVNPNRDQKYKTRSICLLFLRHLMQIVETAVNS